jgi:3-methyl-2-oxobutanoate hydroxymethyltransferase
MSHSPITTKSITTHTLLKKKSQGELISMVTCYDSAFGNLVDNSSIDVVLVGDSLGNVVLGYESTIPVTMDDMIHHTAAVTRVVKRPLVVADMPFMSYSTVELALTNAGKLLQRGGASAVKLEGGTAICPQVKSLVDLGIPVMGHLGLTPQSVHALGGYKVQAKSSEAKQRLLSDALALQEAGAFALVLELIPESLAKEVSSKLTIPTIGIGAGPSCDGQVLVLHDLLGFNKDFSPKFLKKYADLDQVVTKALNEYDNDVKTRKFPTLQQSFE